MLSVHQIHRERARTCHRLAHRVLGDFVKYYSLYLFALEGTFRLQQLVQVPRNGLALPVRVGGEEQGLRFLERARNGVHVLLISFHHLILHGEVMLGVDGAFFRHQIAHMAIRGEDFEVLAEVFLDGLRLGGRLHDNEVAAQSRLMQRVGALFEDQVFHLRVG